MPQRFIKIITIIFLMYSAAGMASGGYDNGTPAGKGNLDIELTWNPFNMIKSGQSYVVWGYGLTNRLDFHGYFSRPVSKVNQLYCGLMYNFMSNKYVDLSTALGLRFRNKAVHSFFPQLLYTFKLPKNFDIIGSVVLVYSTSDRFSTVTMENIKDKYRSGTTLDIALRIPVPLKNKPYFIRGIKLAVGAFKGVSGHFYPTYSVDFRFNLHKPA